MGSCLNRYTHFQWRHKHFYGCFIYNYNIKAYTLHTPNPNSLTP